MAANKEESPPPPENEAPKKKSRKLLIIVAAVSVAVVALIAVVLVMLLKAPPEADPAAAAAAARAEQEAKAAAATPVFERLETFTVNLLPEKGEQYLQTEITLEIESPEHVARLKTLMPRVRNQINLILAGKKASEVMPKEGKEALAAEIRADVNAIIAPPKNAKPASPGGPVMAVLFTSFIIQ
jgi:flagellar FliL protein